MLKSNIKIISLFLCSYASMFIIALLSRYAYGEQIFTFWFDSGDYFWRGKILYETSFDITSIDGFRGVIFPFILACVHALGGESFFYILSPFIFVFFTLVIVSLLFTKDISIKSCSWSKLFLFNLLIAILFIGVWLFPLSDLWALFFLSISMLISRISILCRHRFLFFLCPLFSGIFLYFSYNIRTIYLYAALIQLLIYIYIYI